MGLKAKCRVAMHVMIRKMSGDTIINKGIREGKTKARKNQVALFQQKGEGTACLGTSEVLLSAITKWENWLCEISSGAGIIYKQLIHSSNVSAGSWAERKWCCVV